MSSEVLHFLFISQLTDLLLRSCYSGPKANKIIPETQAVLVPLRRLGGESTPLTHWVENALCPNHHPVNSVHTVRSVGTCTAWCPMLRFHNQHSSFRIPLSELEAL